MKNNLKAMVYVVSGIIFMGLALYGIVLMYFSSTFIPVYVGGTYIVANQVVRYAIYAILGIIVLASIKLTAYGVKFLIKRFRKLRRR